MTQQSHCWAYTPRKPELKETRVPQCSLQHCLQQPGWVMRQMLRAGALGRPRGMGWRGRQEGGSRWGTHVNPWLIHVNVLQKTPQHCKVISLQLRKINEKKKSCHPYFKQKYQSLLQKILCNLPVTR